MDELTDSLSFSLNQILSLILYLSPTITPPTDNCNKPGRAIMMIVDGDGARQWLGALL